MVLFSFLGRLNLFRLYLALGIKIDGRKEKYLDFGYLELKEKV